MTKNETIVPESPPSADDIRAMSYNELIGLVRETNRPPGGSKILQLIANRLFLSPAKTVLEIGCATGWTSISLASLSNCQAVAIDINPASIAEARRRSADAGVTGIDFRVADALNIPLPDRSIDVVFCGNVTSLLSDAQGAMREYVRVLRPGGALVAIPMYYVQQPSDELVVDVRRAIQVAIPVHFKDAAIEPFRQLDLAIDEIHDFVFDSLSYDEVESFCDLILSRQHLATLDSNARSALSEVYRQQMQLFRRNLSMMGFSVMIFRKPQVDAEPELFTASPAPDPAISKS